jgi:hypothetical protein
MLRLLLIAAFALTGCSSFYSSSPEEKLAAYSNHRSAWHLEETPKEFGLSRSVQIIKGSSIIRSKNRFSYDGGLGMGTLITRDGYALTAAHVITDPPLDTVLSISGSSSAPGPTIHVHRQSSRFKPTGNSQAPTRVTFPNKLIAYSPDLESGTAVPVSHITGRTLRIVKSFPERDIALIKLPVHTSVCFELRNKPPGDEDILFSSGNWATPYRGTSAGKMTSLNSNHPSAIVIRTTVPLAKGDSGGPVFDAEGRLVGIASCVIPSQLLPYPKLRHSSLRTLDPHTVATLIAEDRRKHR